MMVQFLLLFLGGCAAGVFGSLLGLGGGILLIPYLTLLLGVPMHTAIATSIVAIIATSSAGASLNLERHIVHTRLGMTLEVATVSGALLGGITSTLLSAAVLTKLFAILLFLVGGIMVYRLYTHNGEEHPTMDGILPASYFDEATKQEIHYTVRRLPLTLGVSFIAGNISGLLGVGGGIFKVPAMHIASRVPLKAATATSNFMIGVTGAASAFIYLTHGHVHPFVTTSSALGVLAGSLIGTSISKRIHTRFLTWLFALTLFYVAFQLYCRKG